MCQLLGMNGNVPTDVCFSFEGFAQRSGGVHEHRDGWGIAFYEGRAARLFLDVKPALESPVARLVREYPIRSLNTIAHIRKATYGVVSLANTQPYRRECWGRHWIFAHNGDLHDYDPQLAGQFQPVGESDSERAFCRVLDLLVAASPDEAPQDDILAATLKAAAAEIAAFGTFNFLLSDGVSLYAHCSTDLHYLVREAPFSQAHLADRDVTVDFRELANTGDRVAVIATLPLTDNEQWQAFKPGELLLFRDGQTTELH